MLSGHSERRAIFGDSDEMVNAKTLKILKQGIKCILCIGELKEVRRGIFTMTVLSLSPGAQVGAQHARTRMHPCVCVARAWHFRRAWPACLAPCLEPVAWRAWQAHAAPARASLPCGRAAAAMRAAMRQSG